VRPMMIIRTNLYAGVLAQEHQKKFQPVRIAIAAGVVLVLFAMLCYGKLLLNVRSLRQQAAAASAKEEAVHKNLLEARARAEVLKAKIQYREGFMGVANNRINWAPILEKVLSTLPPNVQLYGLDFAKHGNGKAVVTVDGRVSGEQPRLECDKVRVLLLDEFREINALASSRFTLLEDLPEPVHKAGWTEPAARFTIQLIWNWKGTPHAK